MSPKVSVILPTYNRAAILHNAVQSVLTQTFSDFELLIIDDCSKDETRQVVSSMTDKRIRFVSLEKNSGGGASRNAGIFRSKGEYIAFIDDDDRWLPDKLETQLSFLENKPVDLCYCAVKKTYWSKYLKQTRFNRPKSENLHKAIMQDNFIGGTSSVIVRRTALAEINGFDPSLPALQDWDLYIRLIKQQTRIQGISKPLNEYYKIDEKHSISRSYKKFSTASGYLVKKYSEDPFIDYFKNAIKRITFKRIVASSNFRREFFDYLFKKPTSKP